MNTVKDLAIALIVFVVMLVSRHILLPIVGDNWNLYGLLALICIFTSAFVVMIYYQYIDGYVQQAQWEKEHTEYTITTDTLPMTTWVLETKFRELTDEEIKRVFAETTGFDFDDNPGDGMALMDFAHAVIRKAQEE